MLVILQTALAYARLWHHLDAKNVVVGRLATRIALALQGKHKPIFTAGADCGDYVVVTNTEQLYFTGRKLEQNYYYSHTGYPGGLRRVPVRDVFKRDPTEVLRRAVRGMLPKNRLRDKRLDRLKIFPGDSHPYGANIAKSYEQIPQMETTIRVSDQ